MPGPALQRDAREALVYASMLDTGEGSQQRQDPAQDYQDVGGPGRRSLLRAVGWTCGWDTAHRGVLSSFTHGFTLALRLSSSVDT